MTSLIRPSAVLLSGLALAAWLPSGASAELVGQFSARVKDVKRANGAYTVVAGARVYDSAGATPPKLTRAAIRFPRGARLRAGFLREPFFCDPAVLRLRPDPKRCLGSRFGTGRIVLDARPQVVDALSANVHLFLAAAAAPGTVASVVVLVVPNERTPVYAYQILEGRLVRDSGPRFGYRLELPTAIEPLVPTVTLTLSEIHLTIRGIEARHRVSRCVTRAAGGRCARRRAQMRRLFWATAPACPPGRRVAFGAYYAFEGAKPISRRRSVSCARLLRRPSAEAEGRIPGAPGNAGGR